MKKMLLKRKYVLIGIAILVLAVVGYTLSRGEDLRENIEVQSVTKGDVVEIVSETGFVQATREVTLAFERGGRVATVPVAMGDTVTEGDALVRLDTAEKEAEIAAAYARVRAEQVRLNELIQGADAASSAVGESGVEAAEITLQNAQESLAETTAQYDTLVENAANTLRSSGLAAYLVGTEREDSSYSYTAPTISGTYTSTEEGSYFIDIYNSSAPSGASFHLSGMEVDTQNVSTVKPTAFGTRGLFILFPESFARGSTVKWEIPIPNIHSSSYLTNLNAYNAAVDARDVAVKTAENAVKAAEAALKTTQETQTQITSSARDEKIAAQRALIAQMQSSAQALEVGLRNMTLRAPFAGIVTSTTVEEGEIVNASAPAVSLISDERYELTVYISESDIQEVTVDDVADVMFDAYDDAKFDAVVTKIAPAAMFIEGVRVFEVTLQFIEKDERVRSGLSADIDIHTANRRDVIAIPTRAVVERKEGKFVREITDDDTLVYLPVKTGLRGSDGMTEIVSGLEEGTPIITFAHEDDILKLEVESNGL